MIISASRRSDIPAFYSEWLVNRLQAGFVQVRNPLNAKQISHIPLTPAVVDCIVFWTKNALPMLDKLDCIDRLGYPYYFQWTITPYGCELEPNVPDKGTIIDGFKTLSRQIGWERVVWRYDPVILSRAFSHEYHVRHFEEMCASLSGYTQTCIFSFLDWYDKIKSNLKGIAASEADRETMGRLAACFARIAASYGISLEACAEKIDLTPWGIKPAACISAQRLETVTGYPLIVKKDSNQRANCRCIESIDIGAYDTCGHGCIYCYATASVKRTAAKRKAYDSQSTLLCSQAGPEDKITLREMQSLKVRQISLL